MTNEQQQAACAELARRRGWTDIQWLSGCQQGRLQSSRLEPIPDPFDDPAASRELVTWLAKQSNDIRRRFDDIFIEMVDPRETGYDYIDLLAMPLPVIARAACKALGIEVEE